VGLIIPLLRNMRIPGEIVKGAAHTMHQRDYKLVFADTRNSSQIEAREIEQRRREHIDGLMIWPVDQDPNLEIFKELLYTGPPLVMIDRYFEDIPCDHVVTDNHWAAYEVTSRLIARGHRRIAHFTALTSHNTALSDRRNGYEKALTDHGIHVDPDIICPPMQYHGSISFKHTIAYLRNMADPITAVVTVNDPYAWATYRAIQDIGLSVPDDMEIASFFDELGANEGQDVPFIRIVQSTYEIGLRAGEVLLDRINGHGGPEPIRIALKPTIVELEKA
jgi:DNA-binding LacI/PurR family transcriptional regulator